MPFHPCPVIEIEPHTTPQQFFESFGENPRPVILSGAASFDFWEVFGKPEKGGSGRFFEDLGTIGGAQHTGYTLSNPGYTPGIFRDLPSRFPMPAVVGTVMMRPVISIGINRTGERDIAHHFHPMTVMRLLQGQKIWALRPPDDEECMFNRGTCTDPFYVCDYYALPGSPPPACVQRAGDTILVPDGWFHGTCNNASVTVGWGGQGRRLALRLPECSHCRSRDARGQPLYASTTVDPLLSISDSAALEAQLQRGSYRWSPKGIGVPFSHLGPVAQSPYMAIRSLFSQFAVQTQLEAERNSPLRSPDCQVLALGTGQIDARALEWLRSREYASMFATLSGAPMTLQFRHRSSNELEERVISSRHAAIWLGDVLEGLSRDETLAAPQDAAIICRTPPFEGVSLDPPFDIEGLRGGRSI